MPVGPPIPLTESGVFAPDDRVLLLLGTELIVVFYLSLTLGYIKRSCNPFLGILLSEFFSEHLVIILYAYYVGKREFTDGEVD